MCVQPDNRRYRWSGDGELMLKEVVHRQAAGEDLCRAEGDRNSDMPQAILHRNVVA